MLPLYRHQHVTYCQWGHHWSIFTKYRGNCLSRLNCRCILYAVGDLILGLHRLFSELYLHPTMLICLQDYTEKDNYCYNELVFLGWIPNFQARTWHRNIFHSFHFNSSCKGLLDCMYLKYRLDRKFFGFTMASTTPALAQSGHSTCTEVQPFRYLLKLWVIS